MSILNISSGKSLWRGYEYYLQNRVQSYHQIDDSTYTARVTGSGHQVYDVHLDLEHPRKTSCDCPRADGKRVICEHAIALYFTLFPDEAINCYEEILRQEEEEEAEEEREEALDMVIDDYLDRLSEDQLKCIIHDLLSMSPDWVLDRFIETRLIGDDIL